MRRIDIPTLLRANLADIRRWAPMSEIEVIVPEPVPEVETDPDALLKLCEQAVARIGTDTMLDPRTELVVEQHDFSDTDLATYYAPGEAAPGRYVSLSLRASGNTSDEMFLQAASTHEFVATDDLQETASRLLDRCGGIGEIRTDASLSFRLFFPVTARRVSDLHRTSTAASDAPTILVIDDEDFVVVLAQTVLQRAGFSVLTAASGAEGIKVFSQNAARVSAVLLDVMLGDADGSDIHQALRKIRPDVPIILSTGYASSEIDPAIAHTIATDFLQKPYQPDDLISVINSLISRT